MNDDNAKSAPTLGSLCLYRLPVWLIATCIGAYFIADTTLVFSREIAQKWDRSAMAWAIALPFMIPVWLFQAGCVVVPIALVYEVAAWALFRKE
jgi:hypothetical protein